MGIATEPAYSENALPAPLLTGQFVDEYVSAVGRTRPGDTVGLATMQIADQLGPNRSADGTRKSVVWRIVDALCDAAQRGVSVSLMADERYVRRQTRIGNRDFPNALPLAASVDRAERRETRQRTDILLGSVKESGIFVPVSAHRPERGYTPWMRYLASYHIGQHALAVVHSKAAFVASGGRATAWINTGNLTDSDLGESNDDYRFGMNNLTMRVHGAAAQFIIAAVTGGLAPEAGIHTYVATNGVKLFHDNGNGGEPARLPGILNEALRAVDPLRDGFIIDPLNPKPRELKSVLLLSQYAPNGLFKNALAGAASDRRAFVSIPRQPESDYREKLPYSINSLLFDRSIRGNERISRCRRSYPSHTKVLLVTYTDGTAKIIVGTDNFVTNIQKLVRNDEIAVAIDIDTSRADEQEYLTNFVGLLVSMGEIDEQTSHGLVG